MAKILIRGLFPRMTTSPAITGPNNPVRDGDTVTIRRGAWDYVIEDNETLKLDGVDVLGDVVDNLDGTYSLTLAGSGLLEYIVTPRFGPARTRRIAVAEILDAPATMTSPDAWPEPGSTITVTKGTSGGTPVDGVLTLYGVDVTGDATDTGPALVYTVPDETITEMRTLLFTPVTGPPVSRTIFGNTWEALTQPGTSYNPAAPEWRDAVNWR